MLFNIIRDHAGPTNVEDKRGGKDDLTLNVATHRINDKGSEV